MPSLRHLSPRSATVLRAVIDAVRPRGHGFDAAIDEEVLAEIDRTLPFLPPTLRVGFPLGLLLLEWSPPFLGWGRTRFSGMGRADARDYLRRWMESRLPPRRMLVYGLRALVFLSFYQHPSMLAVMDVRWDERMRETIRLRADTLDRERYGYPR